MEEKKHYKLFKAGKNWCTMAIAVFATGLGLATAVTTGHADTTAPVTEPQTTATTQTNQAATSTTKTEQVATTTPSKVANQQTNVDYKTPVNAGHLDGATSDDQNNVVFTGWHATNQYKQGMNHYMIVLDGNNHELYRSAVTAQNRPDVQKVYPKAPISGQGGFSIKVPESRLMNANALKLVSRYTTSKNGEPTGGADFWFPTIQTKAGWLDQFKVTGNKLTVSGWHADDAAAKNNAHSIILFDRTAGREVTRQVVKNAASADVAKLNPTIANAGKARFNASFNITPALFNRLNNHELVIVSRYNDPKNAKSYSDYWFSNNVVKLGTAKAGYLDHFYVDGANHWIVASGWHADGKSALDPNHFLILFDQTKNKEVARQNVKVTPSGDVAANGYGYISNADQSRFSTTFKIDRSMIGDQFALVSRYSNAANGEGDRSDNWFNNQVSLNANQAWLDNFSQNGTTINVAGWHAADTLNPHHVIILYDWTKNREVGRKEVTNTASGDIAANGYGNILNANKARFNTSFKIGQGDIHDAFQVISRYSTTANGEGDYARSQAWIGNQLLNVYQNPGWMYQINYSQIQANLAEVGHNIGPGYEGVKTYLIKSKLGDANIHNQYTVGDAYAIMNFQRSHGLPATGWVDLNTWKALGYSADLWYGIDSYISPTLTNPAATRQQRIDAMIGAAYQYMGKPWWAGCSSSPAYGVDCSGLAMQALYAGGINPTSASSTHHGYPGNEWNSQQLFADPHFMNIGWNDRQRGDLVFYYAPGTRTIWHVAILVDPNTVIESWPPCVMVQPIVNGQRNVIAGIRRPFA